MTDNVKKELELHVRELQRSIDNIVSYADTTEDIVMDFYFQLEGRLKMKDILKDISDLSMSVMTTQGKRNVRIQHIPNEKLGICWVRIK